MILKASCALAGMVFLHFVFKAINYTGVLALPFTIGVPLVIWYFYENRDKEEMVFEQIWDILDFIDILDFVKK